ncbi:MnhB domain-containing protein [Mucilaginibacter sp.]|nr:MnhB domain-containing protein [Mucilaginibacter sp.]
MVNLIMISRHMHTVKLFTLYTIVEFSFITLMFSRIFNERLRPALYILIGVFSIICILNTVYIQNKIELNTYTRPIGALIIVLYCMSYIIKTGTEERKWTEDSFNWVNAGLLIYYASGVVMFMFNNYFLTLSTWSLMIWAIIDTILLIEYILFAIGFYKCKLPTTTTPLS